jgi:glycosyltransferase involved in cell wall biosynthesis
VNVCFFGAYDPAYPRNRMLRAGLASRGVEVSEVRVGERRAVLRYPALLAAWARTRPKADVLLVPEFRHKDVPLARRLAGRRRLVFDPLVSRHDTLVGDWAMHRPDSAQARWNAWLDRWTLGLADQVLCDTWAHGELFASLGVEPERLRRVPVGAEPEFFAVPPVPAREPVALLYAGGFLPLHGVPVLLSAIALLELRTDLPRFEVTLIGRGIEHDRARRQAERDSLATVRFTGPRPYAELPSSLASAEIVLGAFGSSPKAGRVIPHKVWQGMAAGRAVVTGDGAGVRELFVPDQHLALAPRGDAGALAATLAALLRDPARRAALGREARLEAQRIGTVDAIGAELAAALGS